MRLKKYEGNPILSPNPENQWERLITCNPGAWYENGKFYLLYRAGGDDEEHYIHLGLAESDDGFNFKRVSDKPVVSPSADGPDAGCLEDPRIVKFGDVFYVTYAYRPYYPTQYWITENIIHSEVPESAPIGLKMNTSNSGILMSKDLKEFKRLGRITKYDLDDRDVILFPEKVNDKYVMLHRPQDCDQSGLFKGDTATIYISFSDNMMDWEDGQKLIEPTTGWQSKKVGGSTPPLKTEKGWLTLYHGVDEQKIYRVGVLLLDLNDPSKVIARADDYIMEPEYYYETDGYYKYKGVVFPTGNVIVNDTLYVYYGGGDKYCCVATCSVNEILDFVLKYKK